MREEEKIEYEVCALAFKYLGLKNTKLTLSESGFPDRVFWMPCGKPFLIEFKAPGEEPRTKQLEVIKWLTDLGYEVEVHDNVCEAFSSIIEAAERRAVEMGSGSVPKKVDEILGIARSRCAVLRSRSR